jgi:hypothetical protein
MRRFQIGAAANMKSFWVDLLVKATLPLGTRWVRRQEAAILPAWR